jgi:hypothetical protein
MEKAVEKIAAVYKKVGVRDRFVARFYDAPHRFTMGMQEEAFAWFDGILENT